MDLFICLLFGGSEPSMEYRIQSFMEQFPDGKFVATGLDSELKFFQTHFEKPIVSSVVSWDTLTNITQTFDYWEGNGIIVATGKWHGKRVKRLFKLLGVRSVTIIDSGEPEHWSAIPLYWLYYYLWSAKCMAFIAKKLRT